MPLRDTEFRMLWRDMIPESWRDTAYEGNILPAGDLLTYMREVEVSELIVKRQLKFFMAST